MFCVTMFPLRTPVSAGIASFIPALATDHTMARAALFAPRQ